MPSPLGINTALTEPSRDPTARDRPMSELDPNSCFPSEGGELYITVVESPVRSRETSRVPVQEILGSWMKEGREETQKVFMPKHSTHWTGSTWGHVLLLVPVIPAPHSQSCPVLSSNNFPFFWICFPLQSFMPPLIHVLDLNLKERCADTSFPPCLQQHHSPAPQHTPDNSQS